MECAGLRSPRSVRRRARKVFTASSTPSLIFNLVLFLRSAVSWKPAQIDDATPAGPPGARPNHPHQRTRKSVENRSRRNSLTKSLAFSGHESAGGGIAIAKSTLSDSPGTPSPRPFRRGQVEPAPSRDEHPPGSGGSVFVGRIITLMRGRDASPSFPARGSPTPSIGSTKTATT